MSTCRVWGAAAGDQHDDVRVLRRERHGERCAKHHVVSTADGKVFFRIRERRMRGLRACRHRKSRDMAELERQCVSLSPFAPKMIARPRQFQSCVVDVQHDGVARLAVDGLDRDIVGALVRRCDARPCDAVRAGIDIHADSQPGSVRRFEIAHPMPKVIGQRIGVCHRLEGNQRPEREGAQLRKVHVVIPDV